MTNEILVKEIEERFESIKLDDYRSLFKSKKIEIPGRIEGKHPTNLKLAWIVPLDKIFAILKEITGWEYKSLFSHNLSINEEISAGDYVTFTCDIDKEIKPDKDPIADRVKK